ncbi:hypothetical protein VTI74DRAFT_10068 [Chaetomium olivicolor]
MATYGHEWYCLWGSNGPSASPYSTSWVPCTARFPSLEDLKQHFRDLHRMTFSGGFYRWHCTNCERELTSDGLREGERCGHCDYLGQPYFQQSSWQRHYWVYPDVPSASTSGPLGRVASQDGSLSNFSLLSSDSGPWSGSAGGNNAQYTSGYPYTSGAGNGGGGSYRAVQSVSSRTSSQESNAPCEKDYCHSDGPFGHNVWWLPSYRPSYFKSTHPAKTALLLKYARPVCPAVILLLILSILWVGNLPQDSTDRFCAWFKHVVACVIVGNTGRVGSTEMGVGCVVAGLLLTRLFQHAKFQLKQQAKVR